MPETLPEGDEKVTAVRSMFDAIAPRYDLVNRIMTFRMDVGWRRRTVRDLQLPAGSTVVDLACGTGDLCRELSSSGLCPIVADLRSEEHTSELQSLLRISYAVFCLKNKTACYA